MDDSEMRRFWERSLAHEPANVNRCCGAETVLFACVEPAGCGSRCGVRILNQLFPGRRSTLKIASHRVQTENVRRLRIDAAGSCGERTALVLDGSSFAGTTTGTFCQMR